MWSVFSWKCVKDFPLEMSENELSFVFFFKNNQLLNYISRWALLFCKLIKFHFEIYHFYTEYLLKVKIYYKILNLPSFPFFYQNCYEIKDYFSYIFKLCQFVYIDFFIQLFL